eukprot:TRINITY_DN4136_c0_g2_i1.p1 TRINITY_DN4136_c0_g2~~TRINITY_DN4136_c0_g2_i1.p1  ORF type:complete len:348 (-),score=86.47 TRINITY_DN4136_c0_g2_i1:182-1153(-)
MPAQPTPLPAFTPATQPGATTPAATAAAPAPVPTPAAPAAAVPVPTPATAAQPQPAQTMFTPAAAPSGAAATSPAPAVSTPSPTPAPAAPAVPAAAAPAAPQQKPAAPAKKRQAKKGKKEDDTDNNDYKIVVVGSGGVGKSAFTISFVKNNFIETYDPTIEDCYRKHTTVDEVDCILNILDTAGQEELSALRDQYMRTGQGFILMFSMTSHNSFVEAKALYLHLLEVKDADEVPIVLVGNKSDLVQQYQVTPPEASDYAATLQSSFAAPGAGQGHVPFMVSSAKTRQNVEEVFVMLVRCIRDYYKKMEPAGHKPKKSPRCVLL